MQTQTRSIVVKSMYSALAGCARILVVKRESLTADSLRRLCEDAAPLSEVAVCRTGHHALQQLRERRSEVVLMGLNLYDMDGLDLLSEMLAQDLVDRVLVVSERKDEHSLSLLRKLKIHGFFDVTEEDESALSEAIVRVVNGGSYFSPALRGASTAEDQAETSLNRVLSETELFVLSIIADGCDDEAAAVRIGVRPSTVHTHRRNIMRKLHVQTRAQLMVLAMRRGVVRLTPETVFRPGFGQGVMSETF